MARPYPFLTCPIQVVSTGPRSRSGAAGAASTASVLPLPTKKCRQIFAAAVIAHRGIFAGDNKYAVGVPYDLLFLRRRENLSCQTLASGAY